MEGICVSVIINERSHLTKGVSVSIRYDINQLDLSGARLQVKFDARKVGGVGSKFNVRHSDSAYKGLEGTTSPLMEASTQWTPYVFTVDLTDEIIQNSRALTVTSNGSGGTEKFELEITNVEISILEHVQIDANLFALKTYQMLKNSETNNTNNTSNTGNKVLLIASEQAKPLVATESEVLFEYDTGKVFYYDGAEWREFV